MVCVSLRLHLPSLTDRALASQLPENSRPVQKYVRQPINMKALDGIGIDLAGNRTESYASLQVRILTFSLTFILLFPSFSLLSLL